MTIRFELPDFGGMMEEIANEFKARVEVRTPRSKLDKDHLQDQWSVEKKDNNSFSIVNNFSYAKFVEEGTSKMSGRFMVRTTLEEMPDIVVQAFENAKKNSN